MYHRFDEIKYPSTNIRKEQLVSHLTYLKDQGFKFILVKDSIVESFISAKATHIVKTPLDIFELFCKTYKNQDDFREGMIRNANTVVEKNIGATMRQLSLIRASY